MNRFLIFIIPFVMAFHGLNHVLCQETDQRKNFSYGLEFNFNNAYRDNYQRNGLYSLNGFFIYEKHEIYSGFDITGIKNKKHRLWGFEAGYKYHFFKERRSHFYIELNYQNSRYCKGCSEPVRYNFVPSGYGENCLAFYRVKTNILSGLFGYELFYTRWLSSSLGFGTGFNWGELDNPGFDLLNYVTYPLLGKRSFLLHLFLFKASIRFTI